MYGRVVSAAGVGGISRATRLTTVGNARENLEYGLIGLGAQLTLSTDDLAQLYIFVSNQTYYIKDSQPNHYYEVFYIIRTFPPLKKQFLPSYSTRTLQAI